MHLDRFRFPLPGVKFSVLKVRTSDYSLLFIKTFMAFVLLLLDDSENG